MRPAMTPFAAVLERAQDPVALHEAGGKRGEEALARAGAQQAAALGVLLHVVVRLR